MSNVYTSNGYDNREQYLESLAEDYGCDIADVNLAADLLGPSEDFDGLVSFLEDMENM